MSAAADSVFLFDVDNTLFDNDRFQDDLRAELRARMARAPANAIGQYSRSCAANWVMPTILGRSSA